MRVLVVEDHHKLAEVLRGCLAEHGSSGFFRDGKLVGMVGKK